MLITDVRIRKVFADGNLKAVISITIDNSLAIHDIKVVQGTDRLFAAMPSRKDENGIYRDIVHPIDVSTRDDFERIIIAAYEDCIALESAMSDEQV